MAEEDVETDVVVDYSEIEPLINAIEAFDVSEAKEKADYQWLDDARVACRDVHKRKAIRTHSKIFINIATIFERRELFGLVTDEILQVYVDGLSAFANLVVDDDPETFETCFHVFKSGLFAATIGLIKRFLEESNSEMDPGLVERLQLVGSIALTNFTLQFSQNKQQVEDKEDEILSYILTQDPSFKPLDVVLKLAAYGKTLHIKKSGLNLVSRLADFQKLSAEFQKNDILLVLIKQAVDRLNNMEENEEVILVQLQMFSSIYMFCSPEVLHGKDDFFLRLTKALTVEESESTSPDLRENIMAFFKCLMKRKLIMPGEDGDPKDDSDLFEKIQILRGYNLTNAVFENVFFYANLLKMKEADPTKIKSVPVPDASLLSSLELIEMLMNPISQQNELLNEIMSIGFDARLFQLIEYATIYIDCDLKDTVHRKKTDPDADIDRDKVLAFAKLRKISLYLLNMLATSLERCQKMLQFDPSREIASSQEKKYDFRGDLVTLIAFIITTMYGFDLEGTEVALSLLKNFLVANETRLMCVENLDRFSRDCITSMDVGKVLTKLMTNLSPKFAVLGIGISRLLAMMTDRMVIKTYFSIDAIRAVIDLDTTQVHPIVKAESSRFLAFLVRMFCDPSIPEEKQLIFKEYMDICNDEKVLKRVSFLLQSNYGILIEEALAAFAVVDAEMKSKVLEFDVFFKEDSEDLAIIRELQCGNPELENLLNGLDELDVNITEEDVDLSQIDEDEVRRQMMERMIEHHNEAVEKAHEAKVEQSEEGNQDDDAHEEDGDKKEDKLEKVSVRGRVHQISRQLFHFEDIDEEQEAHLVALAKNILN